MIAAATTTINDAASNESCLNLTFAFLYSSSHVASQSARLSQVVNFTANHSSKRGAPKEY